MDHQNQNSFIITVLDDDYLEDRIVVTAEYYDEKIAEIEAKGLIIIDIEEF